MTDRWETTKVCLMVNCGVVPSSRGRDKAGRRLLAKPRRCSRRGRNPKTRRLLEKPKEGVDLFQSSPDGSPKDDLPGFPKDEGLNLIERRAAKASRLGVGTRVRDCCSRRRLTCLSWAYLFVSGLSVRRLSVRRLSVRLLSVRLLSVRLLSARLLSVRLLSVVGRSLVCRSICLLNGLFVVGSTDGFGTYLLLKRCLDVGGLTWRRSCCIGFDSTC